MKFCLISGPDGEDVKHIFLEEARRIFDKVLYVPLGRVRVDCKGKETKITFKNTDLSEFDVIYVRVFEKDFLFAEVVLDVLEQKGVYLPTTIDGYQLTNHKYSSVQAVARIGVPTPSTALSVTPKHALEVAKKVGFPIVLKLLRGFGGKGVMMVHSEAELRPILDTLSVFNEFPCTQSFVENPQTDVRALVIGEKVIGIRRRGSGTEWRANVSTGGSAEMIKLEHNIRTMAKKIAQLLGMDICAVDFIETKDGPVFIEANFTPGIMPAFFSKEASDGHHNELCHTMLSFLHKKAMEHHVEKAQKEA